MRNVLTTKIHRWSPVLAVLLVCGRGAADDPVGPADSGVLGGRLSEMSKKVAPYLPGSRFPKPPRSNAGPASPETSNTAHQGPERAQVVTGSRLGIRPGETAAERSLELQSRRYVGAQQNEGLATRVEELEAALRQQNQRLQDATRETQAKQLRERVEMILAGETLTDEKVARIVDAVLDHRDISMQRPGDTSDVQLAQHIEPIALSDPAIGLPVGQEPSEVLMGATPSQGPAVSGSRLGILPGSTASERCFALMAELKAVEDEKQKLQTEVHNLQVVNQQQEDKLVQATSEIRSSRMELQKVRALLDEWKNDMSELRKKARNAEDENLDTLRAIVILLQELLGEEAPRGPGVQPHNGE